MPEVGFIQMNGKILNKLLSSQETFLEVYITFFLYFEVYEHLLEFTFGIYVWLKLATYYPTLFAKVSQHFNEWHECVHDLLYGIRAPYRRRFLLSVDIPPTGHS